MPAGYTITARVYGDGKHEIHVYPGRHGAEQADLSRRRATWTGCRTLDDWQVAEAETLPELRRVLMSDFGLGWFNRARGKLDRLPTAAG